MDAVVFDWDGTLVDTLGGLYRANLTVLEALGLPFDERLYRRHYAPDWRLMYRRLGVPADRLDEANARWQASFDAGSLGEPFPGVVAALERLRQAGHQTGLVTAGHRDLVEPQIERARLGGLLDVRVYGDDLPVHKPDPRPLRVALHELGVPADPRRAAYVGDAPDDMRMAREAGVAAVGIVSILSDRDELVAAGASSVAGSVREWVATLLEPVAGDPIRRPA